MAKDPAFLFYSKDFYEGTRTMLPEERACYIDLLIYQHQNNGLIPLDLRRVLLYCNGIDMQTLEATLKAKFKKTEKGYTNEKLSVITSERKQFINHQSISGSIGAFWKKCKSFLSEKEYSDLRKNLKDIPNKEIYNFIKDEDLNQKTLKGSLIALLKHLAIGNVIGIEDENKDEGLIYPTFDDFWDEYDKKVGKKSKIEKKWNSLSQATKEKIMSYIPNYKISQPDKQFRKNPESFLNNESWNDELITQSNGKHSTPTINRQSEETYRQNGQGW